MVLKSHLLGEYHLFSIIINSVKAIKVLSKRCMSYFAHMVSKTKSIIPNMYNMLVFESL